MYNDFAWWSSRLAFHLTKMLYLLAPGNACDPEWDEASCIVIYFPEVISGVRACLLCQKCKNIYQCRFCCIPHFPHTPTTKARKTDVIVLLFFHRTSSLSAVLMTRWCSTRSVTPLPSGCWELTGKGFGFLAGAVTADVFAFTAKETSESPFF